MGAYDQATRRETPRPLRSRWPQAPTRARASRLRAIHQASAKASWSRNRFDAEMATGQRRAPFGKGARARAEPCDRPGSVQRASPRLGTQANAARPTLKSVGPVRHCDLRLGEPRPPRPQQPRCTSNPHRDSLWAPVWAALSAEHLAFALSSVPHRHSRASDQRRRGLLEGWPVTLGWRGPEPTQPGRQPAGRWAREMASTTRNRGRSDDRRQCLRDRRHARRKCRA
jgi:hypothetical protein